MRRNNKQSKHTLQRSRSNNNQVRGRSKPREVQSHNRRDLLSTEEIQEQEDATK